MDQLGEALATERDELFEIAEWLLKYAPERLTEFLKDGTLPLDVRERLIIALKNSWYFSWPQWKPFFEDPQAHPDVTVRLIRHIGGTFGLLGGEVFSRLTKLPDVPFCVREALLTHVWSAEYGVAEETGSPVARFSGVLDLVEDPGLVSAVFANKPLSPAKQVPEMYLPRVLCLLKAHATDYPAAFCGALIARVSPQWDVSDSDRQFLIKVGFASVSALPDTEARALTNVLIEHATYRPDFARKLLNDASVPAEFRILIAEELKLTLVEAIRFARDLRTFPSQDGLCDLVGKHLPSWIRIPLEDDLRNGGTLWQQLLNTPGIDSHNAIDLVPVLANTGVPGIIRDVAMVLISASVDRDPSCDSRAIFERILTLWKSGNFDDDEGLTRCTQIFASISALPTVIRCLAADVLPDPSIPRERRLKLLKSLEPSWLVHDRAILIESLIQAQDSELCADILAHLTDHGLLSPESIQLAQTIRQHAGEDLPEHATLELRALHNVFSVDSPELLTIARRTEYSSIIRNNAVLRIFTGPSPHHPPLRRKLLAFVSSPSSQFIWDNPRLQREVPTAIARAVRNKNLRNALYEGPSHPLWQPIVAMLQLPDLGLVDEIERVSTVPLAETWSVWRRGTAAHVPEDAALIIHQLAHRSENAPEFVRQIDHLYARIGAHHATSSELTNTFAQILVSPSDVRDRVLQTLVRCRELGNAQTEELVRLVRYASSEAYLGAQADQDTQPNKKESAGAPPEGRSATVKELSRMLEERFVEHLGSILPGLAAHQLKAMLESTSAPVVLAPHYQKIHPQGLPLLATAIRAASHGQEAWKAWRFERPEARTQLAHLSESEVCHWRENLTIPVGIESVPDDITDVASRIRTRLQRAVAVGEMPETYRHLVTGNPANTVSPADRIRHYQALGTVLGKRLAGESRAIPEEVRSILPETFLADLDTALASVDRQHLLSMRHQLDRTVDLLRLLHCDPEALAQNRLRARGENDEGDFARAPNAVAYAQRLGPVFRSPLTREQPREESPKGSSLDAAFADVNALIHAVRSFASSKYLVAEEVSDFKTLVEIGHVPYGQGSCQSFLSKGTLNGALLAYVVDAMTKAIVIRSAPTSEKACGSILARAIVRVGRDRNSGAPVLVVERTYASAGQQDEYTPFIRKAAVAFAAQRGWRVAEPADTLRNAQFVEIPGSQNGVQYEDGARSLDAVEDVALKVGPYALAVCYLDAEDHADHEVEG